MRIDSWQRWGRSFVLYFVISLLVEILQSRGTAGGKGLHGLPIIAHAQGSVVIAEDHDSA